MCNNYIVYITKRESDTVSILTHRFEEYEEASEAFSAACRFYELFNMDAEIELINGDTDTIICDNT